MGIPRQYADSPLISLLAKLPFLSFDSGDLVLFYSLIISDLENWKTENDGLGRAGMAP